MPYDKTNWNKRVYFLGVTISKWNHFLWFVIIISIPHGLFHQILKTQYGPEI
jgi:hypothetical protein